MPGRVFICTAIAALTFGSLTTPAFAGGDSGGAVTAAPTGLPELKGFTRSEENGVTVYRGRTPVQKTRTEKTGSCDCGRPVQVRTTVIVVDRHPPAHLRTQGFYSGTGPQSHSFTHGFYSG